jgi:dihydroorotate dehydrogenase (NAD+) catalytic subunit
MSPVATVAGLEFPNQVLLASGTAGYGTELNGTINLRRLGGLVTKAVSLQPRSGNAAPRVGEFHGGMINSVGLANPGVEAVRARDLPELFGLALPGRVLVNVVGFVVGEYAEVIVRLDDLEGHAGYELNLSCPNSSAGGLEFGADPASVAAVVTACRAVTKRPLFAKLSPALPDIPAIARSVRDAGADGVTLVNTMPGLLHDGDATRLGNGFGGVSGPALLASGIAAVSRVRTALPELPIIGVGGIRTADDARQYLRAGAQLVAIGTAALAAPRAVERIIDELGQPDG